MQTWCPFTKPSSWTSCKKLAQGCDCSCCQPLPSAGGQKSHTFGNSAFQLDEENKPNANCTAEGGSRAFPQALPSTGVSSSKAPDSATLELV